MNIYSQEWPLFEWKEEIQILGMPHFYLGINIHLTDILLVSILYFISAFIFLGIGSGVALTVFICELFMKIFKLI